MLKHSSLLLVIFSLSCINNVAEPEVVSKTVSYSKEIQTIFNQSCSGSGCHINGSATNGVDLTNYTTAINSVGTNYGKLIIIAGKANESPLVEKIKPNPSIGSQMPLTGNKLTSTQIATIEAWINQGALNN